MYPQTSVKAKNCVFVDSFHITFKMIILLFLAKIIHSYIYLFIFNKDVIYLNYLILSKSIACKIILWYNTALTLVHFRIS